MDKAQLLPNKEAGHDDYPVELKRWYILFVFSLFSFNQCLVWFTFSSVSDDKVISYYGTENMDDSVIALLLNWGPIIGIVMFPLQVYITQRNLAGFQHATILGATLVFAGTVVRAVPCLCSESFRQSSAAIILLHIGQILNAAGTIIIITVLLNRKTLYSTFCRWPSLHGDGEPALMPLVSRKRACDRYINCSHFECLWNNSGLFTGSSSCICSFRFPKATLCRNYHRSASFCVLYPTLPCTTSGPSFCCRCCSSARCH